MPTAVARKIFDDATQRGITYGDWDPLSIASPLPIDSLYMRAGGTLYVRTASSGNPATDWAQLAATSGFLPLTGGALNAGAGFSASGPVTFSGGLALSGGPTWTTAAWTRAESLPNLAAIGFGIGYTAGVNRWVVGASGGNFYIGVVPDDTSSAVATYPLSLTATAIAAAVQFNANAGLGALNITSPRIFLNRTSNSQAGISFFNSTYTAWQIYMGPANTASQGYNANITTPVGTIVTSWAIRSVIENVAGYGWTFESTSSTGTAPVSKFEIRSDTGAVWGAGNATFAGILTAQGSTHNLGVGTNGGTVLTINGGTGSTTSNAQLLLAGNQSQIGWQNQTVTTWIMYLNAGSSTIYLRDMINLRSHVTYAQGSTSALALTQFDSRVIVSGLLTASAGLTVTGTITLPAGSIANAATSASVGVQGASAPASTIVLRDGSGHIYSNYGLFQYVNTTDDVNAGNVSGIIAKFGDSYHRTATAAKVAAFITGQTMDIVGTSTNITAYPLNQLVSTTAAVTFASLMTGTATGNTGSPLVGIRNGSGVEFGHNNAAGYRGTLGAESSAGSNFLTFHGESGTTTLNSYRTRGLKASILRSDLGGGFKFSTVASTNADNQAASDFATLGAGGMFTVYGSANGLQVADRTTGASWILYSTGGVAFLYHSTGGNVFSVSTSVLGMTGSIEATTSLRAGSGGSSGTLYLGNTGNYLTYNGSGLFTISSALAVTGALSVSTTLTVSGHSFFSGHLYINGNGSGNYAYGLVGVYDPTRFRLIYQMGTSYPMTADGSSLGSLYGLYFGYDSTNTGAGYKNITGKNLAHGIGVAIAGVTTAYVGAGVWTSGNVYANDVYLI